MNVSVSPVDEGVDLLGKNSEDLQTGIVIRENAITGTLNYVTGYTGFNESDVEEQSGNYLALKMSPTPADAITTVEIVGGKKDPVQIDDDLMFVGRISSTSQSIRVVTKANGKRVTKTYSLSGLTLVTE